MRSILLHTGRNIGSNTLNFRPFIVKKPSSLPMVEKVLKAMKFVVTHAQNYDPKGIISHRRVQVHRSAFIHSIILDLS